MLFRSTAFEGVVPLLRAVDPRVEQCNVTCRTARAGTKSSNKVARLEAVPCNFDGDLCKGDCVATWSGGVESHGDETRAVGAVSGTFFIWPGGVHVVWDVLVDPVHSAVDDFGAADLAPDRRMSTSAAGCLAAFETGGTGA